MHYIKNKNIMKFIIKSLKENIFVNLLILIIFLSIFMQRNYDTIDRYLKGYKYHPTNIKVSSYFKLKPKNQFFLNPGYLLLEKKVKEYFKEYKPIINYSISDNEYILYFTVKFKDSQKTDNKFFKINEFNSSFIEEYKKKINELYFLDQNFFIENDNQLKDIIKLKKNNIKELYSIEASNILYKESLKLGQKKKILLSKMIIGDLIVTLFSTILFCLIIPLIRKDVSNYKN